MKAVKLSLAAALVASSAFAVENVKVDGQVKLWYQTVETSAATSATLGDSVGSSGNLIAKLRVTGDLSKAASFGLTSYAGTTLGLENNLVGATASAGAAGTAANPYWLGEAFMVYKASNTIVKMGRQELDTPLAFTETWNAAPNTFEAAVLVNKDLPDTTLVAAFVSKGNGNYASTVATDGAFSLGYGRTATLGAADSGAYAVGMVNKSIPGVTLHPVYYQVQDLVAATWVDATVTNIPGVKLEAQYANLDVAANYNASAKSTTGYAVQASTTLAGVDLSASYASIGKGALNIANTATLDTNFGGGRKTKIFTATIASDGAYAGAADSTSYKVAAATKVGEFKLGAAYGSYSLGAESVLAQKSAINKAFDTTELDLSVGTKIDEINVTAYYVKQTNFASGTTGNGGLLDRDIVRVIASIDF